MYDYRKHLIDVEKIGLNYQAIIWRNPQGDQPRHVTELVAHEQRAIALARKWIDRKLAKGEW